MDAKRGFKGIWIPKEIWLSRDLTLQEKVFLAEIDSLDNDKGCFASNKYFSDFFGLTKSRCSQVIKSLEDKGYIKVSYIYHENSKEIKERVIKVGVKYFKEGVKYFKEGVKEIRGGVKYPKGGYLENAKDNNTVVNNTFNNPVYILSNDENEFINLLSRIPKYPLDREKDLEMYKSLSEKYPGLDLLEALDSWRMYKLDKPLTDKSNARSQITNSFKKYVEWGKCLKVDKGGDNGPNSRDNSQNKPTGKYAEFDTSHLTYN